MGDSAKKKTIRFDSIQCHKRVDSIQFDSIHCCVRIPSTVHTRGSGLWSEAPGPVHRSHNRPASITTKLLIASAEASSDIDANVSHDAILQYSDARSLGVVAVVLNRNFSLRFGSVNRLESIRPAESIRIDSNRFSHH